MSAEENLQPSWLPGAKRSLGETGLNFALDQFAFWDQLFENFLRRGVEYWKKLEFFHFFYAHVLFFGSNLELKSFDVYPKKGLHPPLHPVRLSEPRGPGTCRIQFLFTWTNQHDNNILQRKSFFSYRVLSTFYVIIWFLYLHDLKWCEHFSDVLCVVNLSQ